MPGAYKAGWEDERPVKSAQAATAACRCNGRLPCSLSEPARGVCRVHVHVERGACPAPQQQPPFFCSFTAWIGKESRSGGAWCFGSLVAIFTNSSFTFAAVRAEVSMKMIPFSSA